MESYFNLVPKESSKINGVVLKLSDKKLEIIAGGSNLLGFGLTITQFGGMSCSPKYLIACITKEKAKELEENYNNWRLMQGDISLDLEDITPTIAQDTPGTAENHDLQIRSKGI